MSQLGDRLRLARESQGISLGQAALDTRILQRYIVALEEGDFQQLPGDVYARGFVRNYANYLELPAEELVELYRRERGISDRIKVVPAASAPRVRSYVLPNFFGVFFITFVLLGLTYIALSALGRIGEETPSLASAQNPTSAAATPTTLATEAIVAAAPLPTIVVPTIGATLPADALPTSDAVAGGAAPGVAFTPAPSATPEAPIMVKVTIKENSNGSWLRIQTDGETQFEGIMKAGETQDFQAKRRIFIRSGNPAVVFVSVNGLEQQVLSPLAGKPTNWEWPPQ